MAEPASSERFSFAAIGTSWDIGMPGIEPAQAARALARVKERIAAFDKHYSRFRQDSLIAEMARKAGTYELPEDAEPMFDLYDRLYDATAGKLTPLIGQVLSDAGYDAAYSLEPKAQIPPARPWREIASRAGRALTLREPALIDVGALGKGYLIDIVAEILRAEGVATYTVDAGGDIAHRDASHAALRVGLEDPDDATKAVGIAEIGDASICGSAGNRRAWRGYHHIIDPDTATSPRHIKALWTVAESTLLADGLSTALFFVEPDRLAPLFRFEHAILYNDRTIRASVAFPGTFFKA